MHKDLNRKLDIYFLDFPYELKIWEHILFRLKKSKLDNFV